MRSPTTGVQRYVLEILPHLPVQPRLLKPSAALHGALGHAWEQLVLPARLGPRLLWSPSNTGPLAVQRQVVTVHDLAPLDHPEWLNPNFAAWYRWLLPKLLKRVSHVISVSEFTRDRILQRIRMDPARISVIPHGVGSRFTPAPEHQLDALFEKLPCRRYFLSVGSLEPRKNLATLLRAWALAQTEIDADTWLVIVGQKGTPRVFAETHMPETPARTHWAGRLPDELLPAAYTGALALLYPSKYEGSGMPPLEAMACGTPALTSNQTALPETVGDAALTLDPETPDDWAHAMLRIARDDALRAQLRLRGLERAARFSWGAAAAKTHAVLTNC